MYRRGQAGGFKAATEVKRKPAAHVFATPDLGTIKASRPASSTKCSFNSRRAAVLWL